VTFPMMRNVIAITMMFSLIGSFAGFTLVEILTNGGPLGATQVLGTLSFLIGILSGNLPMGAAIALFMVPILAVAATIILRGVGKRGNEI
jgi:multiple sugar transport system permease protein